MDLNQLDEEYLKLIKDIIIDKDFINLRNEIHHGTSRYEHSLKVSYQAYLYAKRKDLDYKSIAIGGLLHDYFENDEKGRLSKRVSSVFIHPKKALKNANRKYKLNEIEQDIIISHMFPVNIKKPKFKESWVVSLFDKKVAVEEFLLTSNHKFKITANLLILLLFNLIK